MLSLQTAVAIPHKQPQSEQMAPSVAATQTAGLHSVLHIRCKRLVSELSSLPQPSLLEPAASMSSQVLVNRSPPPEVKCHDTLEALAAGKQAREQACAAACINQHTALCGRQVAHGLFKLLVWPWEPCACKVLPPAPLVDEADQWLPEELSALPLLLLVHLLGDARGDCEVQVLAGRVKGAGTAAARAGLVPAGAAGQRQGCVGTSGTYIGCW